MPLPGIKATFSPRPHMARRLRQLPIITASLALAAIAVNTSFAQDYFSSSESIPDGYFYGPSTEADRADVTSVVGFGNENDRARMSAVGLSSDSSVQNEQATSATSSLEVSPNVGAPAKKDFSKAVGSAHKPMFFDNDFSYVCDPSYCDWYLGDNLKRLCLPLRRILRYRWPVSGSVPRRTEHAWTWSYWRGR